MYKQNKMSKTTLKVNTSYIGEPIEHKIQRLINNKEPIGDAAPLIYTARSEGVLPDYNIRTDRFEIAVEATDAISKSNTAKREQRIGEQTYDTMTDKQQEDFNKKYPKNKHAEKLKQQTKTEPKKDGGAESTQGTK